MLLGRGFMEEPQWWQVASSTLVGWPQYRQKAVDLTGLEAQFGHVLSVGSDSSLPQPLQNLIINPLLP